MIIVRCSLAKLCVVLCTFSTLLAQNSKSDAPPLHSTTALTITVAATAERVRFTAPGSVVRMHLEIYAEAGETLFDGSTKGNVFDWTLADSIGQRVVDGSYLCVVTAKTLSGKMGQRMGLIAVQDKQVSVRGALAAQLSAAQQQAVGPVEENAALTVLAEGDVPAATVIAHDGKNGQVTSTTGALTFRTGDVFSGQDIEQMRLTEAGNLGIGTDQPEARLDVNGMIRARQGFQFADGSVLNLAPQGRGLRVTLPSGETATVNLAPSAVAGTANRIPKFATDGSTLQDSNIYQDPTTGNIGIGTTTPQHPFVVRKNGGTLGVHSIGELFVDRDDRNRSASLTVGTAGTLKWIFGMPYQSDGFQVYDLMNNVSRFFVDPTSGGIGIGTTAPLAGIKLDVAGAARVAPGGSGGAIQFGTPNSETGMTINGNSSNSRADIRFDGATLKLVAVGGGLVPPNTNGVAINTLGNVGIGTTTPAFKFDVVGNLRSASSSSNDIVVQTSGGTNAWARYQIQTTNQNWILGSSQNFNGDQLYLTDATANQTRMSIQPNGGQISFPFGNVGIGGTFAPTAKLDARGGSGTGVYGESAVVNSLAAAGVYGKATGSGGVGVIGESKVNNAVGVFGVTTSTAGVAVYARNNSGGRAIYAEGNVAQTVSSNGLVKAMIHVDYSSGTIDSCYNGITNSSTGNCGFILTEPLGHDAGVYRINYGFPVANRFVSLACEYYASGSFNPIFHNEGANYRFFDSTSIEVFTFDTSDRDITRALSFMIILY